MRRWNQFAGHGSLGGGGGGHGHEHDHTSDHSHDQGEVDGVDLFPQIAMDRVRCLNERTHGMGKSCLKPYEKRLDHRTHLLSDEDDPECIIHVPFTESIRLVGLCICGNNDDTAPKHVKVFVNREDIDFSLAEDLKADMELKDLHRDVSADIFYFPPRNGKFTTCHSLTLYVSDNYGGDSTRINFIGFRGVATKLKRQVVHAVYELYDVPESNSIDAAAAPQIGK